MDKIRRVAPTLVLWMVVAAGVAVVAAAWEWAPAVARHAAGLGRDPLPGAARTPTAKELEAARKAWMRRKFDDDRHGPSVEDVIDYHNRKGIGPPTPPDAIGAPE